jgi:hypothetical protein
MEIETLATAPRPRRAAVYVESRHAIVAVTTPDGEIVTYELVGGPLDDDAVLMKKVVQRVGPRDRLFVAGNPDLRTELERNHVGIYRRPDCLVDLATEGRLTASALVERVRQAHA